jgi:hypothetical protein
VRRGRGILAWLVGLGLTATATRQLVALPEQCPTPRGAAIDRAINAATGWFARAQHPDGTFVYRYDTTAGRDLGGYNWVRHAGVMLSLYQASALDPQAGAIAEAARPALLAHLQPTHGGLALEDNASAVTGGTALAALALMQRLDVTGDRTDVDRLRSLGAVLVQQVAPDGSVRETIGSTPADHSPFSTGQVLDALVHLDTRVRDPRWNPAARLVADYLAHHRAAREGYVPDWPDHWAAYAFAEAGRAGPVPDDQLAWVRKQLGIESVSVRWEAQRTNTITDRWTRGSTSLGAAVGTMGEALAAGARLATTDPRLADDRGWLKDRVDCVAGLLVDRQHDPDRLATLASGSWTRFGVTQMDDQQHALSALVAVSELRRTDSVLPRRSPVPRAPLLVLLATVAALSPWRLARRVRAAGAASQIALGATSAALLAVAVASGATLRALQVSVPTGVIAAGLALAIGMAWTAVDRPDPIEADAVVAVLTAVLRPDVLLLALATGAGGRGWVFAAGVVVAGSTAMGLAQVTDRIPLVLSRWLIRLTAAAGLVAALALVVEGVYGL